MAMRPNYNQQRGDRDRAKEQKKKEKLRKREEETARRKGRDPETTAPAAGDAGLPNGEPRS